jgi:MFS family permease
MPAAAESAHNLSPFAYRGFALYLMARATGVIATEMLSVAVAWQVYEITRKPLNLGLVGLAQFFPGVLLFLLAGHVADRFARKRTLVGCYLAYAFCAALLLHLAMAQVSVVAPIYLAVTMVGVVRTFDGPVRTSLLTELVPDKVFPTAVALHGSFNKAAQMTGPMLGGLIYAASGGPRLVYLGGLIGFAIAVAAAIPLPGRVRSVMPETVLRPGFALPNGRPAGRDLRTLLAGLRYIREHRIVLGAISLDLFAVLLGGAVALLPVYARDILKTGPWGLGLLRAAPGIGATIMGAVVAHRSLRKNVGALMLWCVALFGATTVVFGLSRNLWLSLAALLVLGASDMVSVIVRQTVVQVATPDEMRGRVSAVNMLFIGTSNQLGEFESGLTAAWFGTVPAVVLGGIGSLVVVAIWAWVFPELRKVNQLTAEELRHTTLMNEAPTPLASQD